LYIVIKKILKR